MIFISGFQVVKRVIAAVGTRIVGLDEIDYFKIISLYGLDRLVGLDELPNVWIKIHV